MSDLRKKAEELATALEEQGEAVTRSSSIGMIEAALREARAGALEEALKEVAAYAQATGVFVLRRMAREARDE